MPDFKDLTVYTEEIGSIGRPNDVETAGGGRIVVISDSITFTGAGAKIQANARPYSDFTARRYSLSGGSGGYIYVKTANANKQNSLSSTATVEAMGGYAIGDYTGGSGGVVIFDGGFFVPVDRVMVNGGVSERKEETGCANGAAGTVYYTETDTLVIDNKGVTLTAATTVDIPVEKQNNSFEGLSELAKKLIVQGNARLIIKGEHSGLTFNELFVFGGSWVEFGEQEDMVNIRFIESAHIAKDGVLDFSKTKRVLLYQGASNVDLDSQTRIGTILFQEFLGIRGNNVHLTGNITVPAEFDNTIQRASKFGIEAENIKVYEDVAISSGFTFLHANDTV